MKDNEFDSAGTKPIETIQITDPNGTLQNYVIEMEPSKENQINLKPLTGDLTILKGTLDTLAPPVEVTKKLKRTTSMPDVLASTMPTNQESVENGSSHNYKKKKRLLKSFKPFENFKFYFANQKSKLDIEKLGKAFNSYSSKKTYATGFYNLALVTNNFSQIKYLISINNWTTTNIVLVSFLGLSIVLQFGLAIMLVFLVKQAEFIGLIFKHFFSNSSFSLFIFYSIHLNFR
jgi:hypothetical protein